MAHYTTSSRILVHLFNNNNAKALCSSKSTLPFFQMQCMATRPVACFITLPDVPQWLRQHHLKNSFFLIRTASLLWGQLLWIPSVLQNTALWSLKLPSGIPEQYRTTLHHLIGVDSPVLTRVWSHRQFTADKAGTFSIPAYQMFNGQCEFIFCYIWLCLMLPVLFVVWLLYQL